ncbi:MAG: hypothetical protein IPL46_15175 [Saprospiraceae bacterium]|nr:hypothetical protein [Saprospiraceae bacterium]
MKDFLHYVIALDLLFGEKDSSTNSITTKVAICTFKSIGSSYNETLKVAKHIYDMRSRYVHSGIEISSKDLEVLENINNVIFYVLLSNLSKESDIENWLKRLNILISKKEAEVEISSEEYQDVGISCT